MSVTSAFAFCEFYCKLSKQMPLSFVLLYCCLFVTVNSTSWHFLLGISWTFECFMGTTTGVWPNMVAGAAIHPWPRYIRCVLLSQKTHRKYPSHGWFAAAMRMRMYLWWGLHLKMSTDQELLTRRLILEGRGGTLAPVLCGDKMKEFCELVHTLCPAPRREHVMGKVVNVVPLPFVRVEVSLHMMPSTLDCIGVGAILMVNELCAIVDGVVCVISCVKIAVLTPAVTDDCSAGFDPWIYNGHQSVGSSVWNGNEKRTPGLAPNTAKHPLPLNRMAPAVLALTELSLIDLHGLVRTADLLRAALHLGEHLLSAELAPVRERIRIEVMLLFDTVCRYVAYDVVCEKHNLLECEVSMLKPWTVLDRFGLRAHGNRPPTSPPISMRILYKTSFLTESHTGFLEVYK